MRKMWILILALVCSFVSNADVCQPSYWETDPEFVLPINDLQIIASQGIQLEPIEQTKGVVPGAKTTYKILNINTTVTYDGSKIQPIRSNEGVTVKNAMLNFDIKYSAESKNAVNSSKKYHGNASASLHSLVIQYTKTAVIDQKGMVSFNIKNVVITNSSAIIAAGDYDPKLDDHTEFDLMLKTTLTNELITYYKTNLQSKLSEVTKSNSIPYTFKTQPYIYQFGDHKASINTKTTNLSILEKGYRIGYAGIVDQKPQDCSQFIPQIEDQASYISYGFVQSVFNSFYNNSQSWKAMILDQTNTKSSYFNFYMIDLEQIIPKALVDYPKYFDRIYANCSIVNAEANQLNFITLGNKINTSLTWNCGIFRSQQNINLLNFNVKADYRVTISQIKASIEARLEYARLNMIQFVPVDNYPVANQDLATMYINSIIYGMEKSVTVGSGFLQPERKIPEFSFLEDNMVIKISEKFDGEVKSSLHDG